MTERSAERTYGSLPPDEALALLGNEVRAKILHTLSEARGGRGPPPVLPFSELRERTDGSVESSRFNYHLQQLVGTFVERVDPRAEAGADDAQPVSEMAATDEEGFRLRPEGTTMVRTIRAWSVAGEATVEPFDLEQSCHHCGGSIRAQYRNAIFAIQCADCEYLYDYNLTPPGILNGPDDRLLERVAAYNRQQRFAFAQGTCPLCGGGVDAEFLEPETTGYPRGNLRSTIVRRGCSHCGNKDTLTTGEFLLGESEVIAFCRRRGLDLMDTPIWEVEFAATDRRTTVEATDPWRVTTAVELDGEALECTVDETLEVVDRERY
ncbi:hypothetical protein SAMN05444422_105198 [Halobiforma haloterrestris]|uniref:Uncharacterized protein n=1 Tax=Natronobacterium haloterrestre TaxID=148448 RepID=A0A1I1H5F8_NATHA|nr:helix-turn-helix transcriptional regulator [Halobiforma haloterrestris]SFC19051.1 hypothetical protein SAMN05444422_105198 [Halobiforma haloterrestris]